MFLFFPIGHEQVRIRRWPIATIAIIALNVGIYFLTIGTIRGEESDIAEVRAQIERLKVDAFLEIEVGRGSRFGNETNSIVNLDARNITDLNKKYGQKPDQFWSDFTSGKKVAADHPLFMKYIALKKTLDEKFADSILGQYALIPSEFSTFSALTSLFLHGGLLHLIGNMFILFLAGAVLEDVLGFAVFLALYLLAGLAGAGAHVAFHTASAMPCIGASGAVAGLMGAFLIRFYKAKIQFFYLFFPIATVVRGTVALPAFLILPFWFLWQLLNFEGGGIGSESVAYMAHAGGFAFGALSMAVVLLAGYRKSSAAEVEDVDVKTLKQAAEDEFKEFMNVNRLMRDERYDEAQALLEEMLAEKPDNIAALKNLVEVHLAQNRPQNAQTVARRLSGLLAAAENTPALRDLSLLYLDREEDPGVPDRALFEMARGYEQMTHEADAIRFYDEVYRRHPSSPLSAKALFRAAKLASSFRKDPKGVRNRLSIIAEHFPTHPVAEEAQRLLDSGPEDPFRT